MMEVVMDAPEVGKNYHDHIAFAQWYKLGTPQEGLAMGTLKWTSPAYKYGVPNDWIFFASTPREQLEKALRADGKLTADHPLLKPGVGHIEIIVAYAPEQRI
jgi:hypothetical protein